jgi:ubiquinone/menaquinone biosynthesis C-methylase UbiE
MTESPASNVLDVKSCCAALYETEWARLLLGESFHPGGLALTERLGHLLSLRPGSTVLDVACGRGASALHLAKTFGCRVVGVDYGDAGVAAAQVAAATAGLAALTEFRRGDAEALPVDDEAVDAVLCECAFCTFPDKTRAAAEFARVLKPGGRLGLADLTRNGDLPPDLDGLLAWIACIADARPLDEYLEYPRHAGLVLQLVEPHDAALGELVTQVRRRLLGVELAVKVGEMQLPGIDWDGAKGMARAASEAIRKGQLGYALITARRPVAAL